MAICDTLSLKWDTTLTLLLLRWHVRRKSTVALTAEERRLSPERMSKRTNLYVPESPIRCTLTGGGFTKKQVSQGLSKMRTDSLTKAALVEIVYRRQSTLEVSNKSGIPVEKLYVYASRLREHIRQESQAVAA